MKARQLNIVSEELKDRVFPQVKDQYTGYTEVFCTSDNIDKLHRDGWLDPYLIYQYDKVDWQTNLYLMIKGEDSASALAYYDGEKIVPIIASHSPYGVRAKNARQRFLLHALMDVDTPLVIVKGIAGTGKTFCSLAAGLEQTVHSNIYRQILVTKSTKNVDQEELGALPGDLSEKMDPYIRGIYDNLEALAGKAHPEEKCSIKDGKRCDTNDYYFLNRTIEIQALSHVRGRTIANTFYIIDETQNMTPEAIKQIATRAGEGSKFVFLGDPTQIDTPELTENYNGLVYLSELMKGQKLCRQISLNNVGDVIRSPLAQLAVDLLL